MQIIVNSETFGSCVCFQYILVQIPFRFFLLSGLECYVIWLRAFLLSFLVYNSTVRYFVDIIMQRLKIQVHQNRMSNVEHWATEPTSAWSFDFKSVWAALIIHTNSKFLQNFELNQWLELVCHVANDNTDYSVAARKRHWYNSKFWWNFEFVCVIWAAHTDLKSKPHTLEPTARFLAGERNRRGSRNSKILAFLFLWYRCIFFVLFNDYKIYKT